MPGKRVYMTASTAREHTNKLWEKEGKACEGTKKRPTTKTHLQKMKIRLKPHSLLAARRNHFQNKYISSSFLLEVPVRWAGGGHGVKAGSEGFLSRPLLPGAAGGPTVQVQRERTHILYIEPLEVENRTNVDSDL